mmetsp:Transcript_145908/g.257730  ORF Transcript_145908/g.257730 Transcript_145908/m.257730 type:complete len:271 (+) Transcript_145908:793-1605(+)
MEVSPSVSNNRSKSSTLRGSVAQRPSALSASSCCTSLASASFMAFFCRLDGLFVSGSPSSLSASASSSDSTCLALNSANWKTSAAPAASDFASWLLVRSHGTSSSESTTSAFLAFLAGGASGSSSSAAASPAEPGSAASSALSASRASSSSSKSSSSSSNSPASKSEALMPSHTFPFSIFTTLARGMRDPGWYDSNDTDAESEISVLCTRASTAELSSRTKRPYFSTALTRPLRMSPTDICSTVSLGPLSALRRESSTWPLAASMAVTTA